MAGDIADQWENLKNKHNTVCWNNCASIWKKCKWISTSNHT